MKFHASLTVLVPSSRALCDFLFFFLLLFFFILMFNYLKAHKPSKMKSAWPSNHLAIYQQWTDDY